MTLDLYPHGTGFLGFNAMYKPILTLKLAIICTFFVLDDVSFWNWKTRDFSFWTGDLMSIFILDTIQESFCLLFVFNLSF